MVKKQTRVAQQVLSRGDFLRLSGVGVTGAVMLGVVGCSGSGNSQSGSNANDYPQKNINLIVQAAAGGTSDLTARTAAKIAEKKLGTNIVVQNRPGAAGSIAMRYVASQPPDGYTIGYLPVEVSMLQYLGYQVKPKDFALINQTNSVPATLTVQANSPYKSYEDFMSAAKKKSGKLSVGNSGPGSIWQAATVAMEQEANVKLKPVPFDGGAPAVAALVGGKIDAVSVAVAEVLSNVKGGKLRVLAVLADKRNPQLPDVPTAKELGHDVQILSWGGFGAPSGTPGQIIDKLNKAFESTVKSDKFRKTLKNSGIDPTYKGPEAFTQFVQSQSKKFSKIVPDMEVKK